MGGGEGGEKEAQERLGAAEPSGATWGSPRRPRAPLAEVTLTPGGHGRSRAPTRAAADRKRSSGRVGPHSASERCLLMLFFKNYFQRWTTGSYSIFF